MRKTFYFYVKIAYFVDMESYSIHYVLNNTFGNKHYVPPHSHTCFELIFYCNSPVEIKYDSTYEKAKEVFDFSASFKEQNTLKLRQNSFVIVPPNVAHDELHLGDNLVMCIGFTSENREDLLPYAFKEMSDEKVGIRTFLEQIIDEFNNKKYGFEQYMNNLLHNLVLVLLRNTKQEASNGDELKYIEQYIKQNIGRNITISSLAQMSGYSISHFRRIFKEYTGLSPKRYIANQRIAVAKQLLKNTSLSLNEIAESVGFTDYFQFATFYKKECGVSPGKDRD